jgi:hypothetical protein
MLIFGFGWSQVEKTKINIYQNWLNGIDNQTMAEIGFSVYNIVFNKSRFFYFLQVIHMMAH